MLDFNLTQAEIDAFKADMLDMAADAIPTDAEMAEMANYYGEG